MASVLYAVLGKGGAGRRLMLALAVDGCALLLLLPAFIWFYLHQYPQARAFTPVEMAGVLIYIVCCGWLAPLAATFFYFLRARTRSGEVVVGVEGKTRTTSAHSTAVYNPPRYQPGVVAPFVFNEETAWGWLEYREGNFQGQRLALKREVAVLGREESCDIWLDDEMASRFHAELAWLHERVLLTDRDSMNGTQVNDKPIKGTVLIHSGDTIRIGELSFTFFSADREGIKAAQDDPLARHTWRSTHDLQIEENGEQDSSQSLPTFTTSANHQSIGQVEQRRGRDGETPIEALLATPVSVVRGALLIRNGQKAGTRILLDLPRMSIGRAANCDIIIPEETLAILHAQIIQQGDADYLHNLTDMQQTLVNQQPVATMQVLKHGDAILLGSIMCIYSKAPQGGITAPGVSTSPLIKTGSGPVPLRLPSRVKQT